MPIVLVSANYPLDDSRSNGFENFVGAIDFIKSGREIIEKRKKETGQNLRAVAKDLDVSLGVLSDWQNGNKTPRGDSIAKLAKYFGVSADYLLGLTEAQTVDTDLRAVADYTGLTENAILVQTAFI